MITLLRLPIDMVSAVLQWRESTMVSRRCLSGMGRTDRRQKIIGSSRLALRTKAVEERGSIRALRSSTTASWAAQSREEACCKLRESLSMRRRDETLLVTAEMKYDISDCAGHKARETRPRHSPATRTVVDFVV